MSDRSTTSRVIALAAQDTRALCISQLVCDLSVRALFGFVADAELGGILVPAPGFASVVPGGRPWRELLAACKQSGIHRCEVGFPTASELVPATVVAQAGLALVFVGAIDEVRLHAIEELMPLLASMLHAEHSVVIAQGKLRVAQESVQHSTSLAVSLDRALSKLETQTRSLEKAGQQAEQSARVKDEFLAMLGHELRNPLAPIVTAISALKLRGELSREHVVIERQAAHMIRLVDDLLDVSRITQGKVELRKERIELADVAARAVEMVGPLLASKTQRLHLDVPRLGLTVHADPARLAQVLSNLLTNASRYSPMDTTITLKVERRAERVIICVRDQGVGLAPEMVSAVFEPFRQVKQGSDRAQGGLGLGLAIVRSLVALHEGTVSAHSEGKGRGSEFRIELPVADDGTQPAALPVVAPTLAQEQSHAQRILIVDDNEDAAEMLGMYLEGQGHLVQIAADGPSALHLASQFDPQIAILDIGLPGMDGHELARKLRAQDLTKGCVLIAVTGYGQATDRQRSKEAGFDAHLVKPVDITRLKEVIDRSSGTRCEQGASP